MFIKIENKKDLIKKLEENKDKELVIHFNCFDCDDEQVTYSFEGTDIEDILIKNFKEHGYLPAHINCTNCSQIQRIIYPEYIQGIEII